MNWQLKENLNEFEWEDALSSLPDGAEALQSSLWCRLILREGAYCHRLAWQNNNKIVALAQVIEINKFGFKFFYIPRGPLTLTASAGVLEWQQVKKDLIALAKKNKTVSLIFEPENWPLSNDIFGKKIKSIQPEKSLFLNLNLSEEELLKAMHHKTRYNIRLAKKRGVEIVLGKIEDLKLFWKLLQSTTARDGFRGHSLSHYRNLLEQGAPNIELWLAKKEDKVLAAGIFSFYQGRSVYLHGASANFGRQYMAPYLLQWQMIRRARENDCRFYDFYGIDEKKWPGVTRFKLGFGGEERNYPGTYLIIIKPFAYYLYKVLSSIKHHLRLFFK
ncbi:peptidoglycan bridge formation glycyltransferase FemA/FemB family protein [Patescibacteria group bacterium]|nr:peptidoglycan bridge formation glycyltransferase FemA/FemB family protein [Patescibacteria group bacterium]